VKTLILKPVMWNTNAYTGPSGYPSHSGYSKKHGYGHEEWNNHPHRVWRGYKVFHTEASPSLLPFSASGDLGILMIAAHDGTQYAVGLATNVFHNTDDEMREIADELGFRERSGELWAVPRVRECFGGDKAAFMEHWNREYAWLRWRCPEEHFVWFDDPIPLDAQAISGKQKLIQMHGRYQQVQPGKILPFIVPHIPSDHDCLQWLTEGEFEGPEGLAETQPTDALRKQHGISGRNSTAGRKYEYWVEGNRTVEPLHGRLQSRFVRFLSEQGIQATHDAQGYIDVLYERNGQTVIAEVKPTENVDTRYAIRAAVGQLLEYRFIMGNPDARLEVVLGSEPEPAEKAFLVSLGMWLAYFDADLETFVTEKPDD
jgi:hypothetical protein